MKRKAQRVERRVTSSTPLRVQGVTAEPDAAFYRHGAPAFEDDVVADLFDDDGDGREAHAEAVMACHGDHLLPA